MDKNKITGAEDDTKENTKENYKENTSEPKTYTEEEVRKLLQAEGDKRVTEALKKNEKKVEARIEEAKKIAVMNEQEKYEYELKKKEKLLQERELRLSLAENKVDATKALADKNISVDLVDLVLDTDKDKMNEKINILEKVFKASVKTEVEKRMSGGSPKTGSSDDKGVSKKEFSKMSLKEQAELLKTNPDLYNQLIK